ncbi:MAG TPA: cellulase family glycosylhydrolase [Polyangiaceae bacterium]|nr:cellulase family glycosylhydrolase [Polyangiaceae bacterium]
MVDAQAAHRTLALSALLVIALPGCLKTPDHVAASTLDAGLNPPANFELGGRPFCFAGANNYYLGYKPSASVDALLDSARALGFAVVRTWAFIDIGSLDGNVRHTDPNADGKKDGVYYQYWDTKALRPAYNDGENGLRRLDYAVAKAAERGLKLILVLTNNWEAFGGMDQYLAWFGRTKHHEFYTDPLVKQAYKNYVAHLIARKNTYSGKLYRDDPAIFAWELANEPRCKGSGPGASGWTNQTIVTWADEMSAHIKSLDPNHMVSVGDEGFLDVGGEHWAYKANDGVDHAALTALPDIDFGTFHAYPEDWGARLSWGEKWIADHARLARQLGKPTILEEYGVKVVRDDHGRIVKGLHDRLRAYERWNQLALRKGINGSMVWMLSDRDGPRLYEDYDQYTVYRGDDTAKLLGAFASQFLTAAPACSAAGPSRDAPSEFVRVRRPALSNALAFDGWAQPAAGHGRPSFPAGDRGFSMSFRRSLH